MSTARVPTRKQLSPHFVIEEFDSHDGVRVPTAGSTERELRDLVKRYLEPLRLAYGPVHILSGFRSAERNKHVGGAERSFHRYDLAGRWGVAADIRCKHGTPAEWHRFLDERGVGGLGLYANFVHVDNRHLRTRWIGS